MKLLLLILLASVASSEEKKEKEIFISDIGARYDLFYAACDCREEV